MYDLRLALLGFLPPSLRGEALGALLAKSHFVRSARRPMLDTGEASAPSHDSAAGSQAAHAVDDAEAAAAHGDTPADAVSLADVDPDGHASSSLTYEEEVCISSCRPAHTRSVHRRQRRTLIHADACRVCAGRQPGVHVGAGGSRARRNVTVRGRQYHLLPGVLPPERPPLLPHALVACLPAAQTRVPLLPTDRRQGEPDDSDAYAAEQQLHHFNLKVVVDPRRNGLEETVNFPIDVGNVIAGRYRIVEYLGSGVFSRAVQCIDLQARAPPAGPHVHPTSTNLSTYESMPHRLDAQAGGMVCIKIIRNNKDFLDQSLGEIKLLQVGRQSTRRPHITAHTTLEWRRHQKASLLHPQGTIHRASGARAHSS